jgi:hypothetical protein
MATSHVWISHRESNGTKPGRCFRASSSHTPPVLCRARVFIPGPADSPGQGWPRIGRHDNYISTLLIIISINICELNFINSIFPQITKFLANWKLTISLLQAHCKLTASSLQAVFGSAVKCQPLSMKSNSRCLEIPLAPHPRRNTPSLCSSFTRLRLEGVS